VLPRNMGSTSAFASLGQVSRHFNGFMALFLWFRQQLSL
jgi:hypothetical protein